MNGRSRKARKAITIISKDELIFYNKKQLIVLAQRIYCKKEDLSAWDSKKREEASNIIINIIENDNYEIFLKTFANVLLLKIIDV